MAYFTRRAAYPSPAKSEATDTDALLSRLESIASLTEYEANAVKDMGVYYTNKGCLTVNQYNFLKKICDRYSDDKLKEMEDWKANFDDEKRRQFHVVCEYYSHAGYFSSIVNQWKDNKEYIPTMEQFKRITENNYAKKVLEARSKDADFALGDLVTARASYSRNGLGGVTNEAAKFIYSNSLTNIPLFVMENNVVSSRDVYRHYKVFLLTNPSIVFTIREKDLKKYKVK